MQAPRYISSPPSGRACSACKLTTRMTCTTSAVSLVCASHDTFTRTQVAQEERKVAHQHMM